VVGAAGLLLTTVAGALARTGGAGAEPLFWAGLLLIVVPAAARLAAGGMPRAETIVLVTAVGVLTYLLKVLHDPFTFVYSDEWVHLSNSEQIARAGALFPQNTILPVTVYYPGLATVAAALAVVTGASPFAAGVVVIGLARICMMLGLYLLFERLGRSAQLAGLAALIYVANPNFLFFGGQFSYQSLALPLAAVALYAAVARADRDWLPWTVTAMVAIAAIAMTHHMTAFALIAILVLVSIASHVRLGSPRDSVWNLAVFGTLAITAWLLQIAPSTQTYLGDIYRRTFEGIFETATGSSAGRQLFQSEQGTSAELWERAVALGSVGLIAVALPFGIRAAWRQPVRRSLLVLLIGAAATYLAILPLRLVPSAWEVANRASDFLFLGVAVVVAFGLRLVWRRWPPATRVVAVTLGVGIVTMGGVIAGWAPDLRLSKPYRVELGGRLVDPQGAALARWSYASLGPSRRFVADQSNARFLLAFGSQLPRAGGDGLARTVLESDRVTPSLIELIRADGPDYVAIDRRAIARDNMEGYFFAPPGEDPDAGRGLAPASQRAKFDRPDTDRIFDSGNIAVYDLRRMGRAG
jgi:hypothetical protein